jgi:hypothetical protein
MNQHACTLSLLNKQTKKFVNFLQTMRLLVRPELHKGLISELQNHEMHKMKPNWVGKM